MKNKPEEEIMNSMTNQEDIDVDGIFSYYPIFSTSYDAEKPWSTQDMLASGDQHLPQEDLDNLEPGGWDLDDGFAWDQQPHDCDDVSIHFKIIKILFWENNPN